MYGMDQSGDGIVDAAELRAYEEYKASKVAEAKAYAAALEASKAADKAEAVTDYDTVPGFAARRGWHGNNINEHNYGEHLKPEDAVFSYTALKPGKMAAMLEAKSSKPPPSPMEPRGRARTKGGGGIEGAVPFYEPDRLTNPFEMRR